jgi:plasmid stabilization system protein ParE
LKLFPYSCRKVDYSDPTLRELLIPFGKGGYAAIFRIRDREIRILAIRHQLEDDYL